ncbi:MAG: hydantoinase B/oxoprolinase family protein [Candidatus Bipolaricaulis sp.]|nr:hydantoinase B/oxoprolinase family protein [Candidatus Bipolaricaulis sp.]
MTSHPVDPFTVEVIKRALVSAAEQMFVALGRTAKSSVIYEVLDYGCAVVDREGRMVAQANGIPPFIGVLTDAVRDVLAKFRGRIRPGDVFMTNDPYMGGATHQNDVVLVAPVFFEGELVLFAASKAHWNDVGGKDPGSWSPSATDIYQEGIQFPVVRLVDAGEEVEDIVQIVARNVRAPGLTLGDMRAQAASLQVAARRIGELCGKFGVPTVLEAIDLSLEQGRRHALAELRSLPHGTYEAEEFIDDDGLGGDPVPVRVRVTLSDDEFIVDFTGTGRTCAGPINCPLSVLISTVKFAYQSVLSPHATPNEGFFAPLRIVVPEDTVFNPKRPAPVSTYWEADAYAGDVIWKALAAVLPDRIPAGHFLSVCGTTVSGISDATGEWFFSVEPNAGGWGAAVKKDGESALVCTADGETYILSAEVAETRYPFLVEQFALDAADAGHGARRGGLGIVKDYRIRNSRASVTASFGRHLYPPWGLAGGGDGSPNRVEVHYPDGRVDGRGRFSGEIVPTGTLVRFITGSGGGYGDPMARPAADVLRDVENGYVSPKAAESVYGVVLRGNPLSVDALATERRRAKRRPDPS